MIPRNFHEKLTNNYCYWFKKVKWTLAVTFHSSGQTQAKWHRHRVYGVLLTTFHFKCLFWVDDYDIFCSIFYMLAKLTFFSFSKEPGANSYQTVYPIPRKIQQTESRFWKIAYHAWSRTCMSSNYKQGVPSMYVTYMWSYVCTPLFPKKNTYTNENCTTF